MTTEHRARPLDLPLPGGAERATVRVHPLLAAEVMMPPSWTKRPGGPFSYARGLGLLTPRSKWYWAPIPAFLVEHPSAGAVLIDTGLHPKVIDSPRSSFGRIGAQIYKVRMRPEQALHEQLRARGVEPRHVGHVVMTHLHWDHSSGIGEFPGATFVVNSIEWREARNGGLRRGYHPDHLHPLYDWRTVDFSAESVESYGSFGRAADLFGDGSVRLLFTPGHTLGHTSVLLRTAAGEVLLAADAAYALATISESLVPPVVADEHLYRRSLKEIQRYLEANPATKVIPGHDPEAWAGLDEVY